MNKEITPKELAKLREEYRAQGKTLVACSGAFDQMHKMHEWFLREAKAQGDILVVLINSDSSIKKYKGSRRPHNTINIRKQDVSKIDVVSHVIPFDEYIPNEVYRIFKPDIVCVSDEYGPNCIERVVVDTWGGKCVVVPRVGSTATTRTDEKIKKAVFLDRDGVINKNIEGYTYHPSRVEILPGVKDALHTLRKYGYMIIVVTNQSWVGRGLYQGNSVSLVNTYIEEQVDFRFDAIYVCEHSPEDVCSCRKPNIGMIEQAVQDFDISLSKSWLVGDQCTDIELARNVNMASIKIGGNYPDCAPYVPNHYAPTLKDAVDIITKDNAVNT